MKQDIDVVIIGAGFAGLGAAITLQEANISCVIVEAQSVPGGRIQTLNVGNTHIDLGAQWIHGDDTKLYKILQENDLIHPETSTEGDGIYVRDDGLIIDDFLVKKVDFEVGRILEKAELFIDFNNDKFQELDHKSLGNFLQKEFNTYLDSVDASFEEKQLMQDVFGWHLHFQKIDNSCRDFNELSLKEWGRYECPVTAGDKGQQHINIKGGYQALINVLLQKLHPNTIYCNKPVQNIDVQVNNKVLLTFEDNSQLKANQVILTVSLGVLKTFIDSKNLILPSKMSKIVNAMGFDGMGKVFLEFHTKWWSTNIQIIWGKDKRVIEDFPEWLRHITGFETVLDQNEMLLLWVGHAGVEEMEKLDSVTVGKQCMQLLRHFLKDDELPLPRNVYKSSWLGNKYVRGGYSHSTPTSDGDEPPGRVLAEPVCDENGEVRLLLAGEAVNAECFSTTHGAFDSGVQQARKLIGLMNL